MLEVEKHIYLGDVIHKSGRNSHNIESRISKSIGITAQIYTILKTIKNGFHFFKSAILLRESMLLSALLVNSESWHNLSKSDVYELEKVDHRFLETVLETPK